jgi:hypothetical protein
MIIYLSDLRRIKKGCVTGWKGFCTLHGFSWEKIVKDGISEEELLRTGDAMAEEAIKLIKEEKNNV